MGTNAGNWRPLAPPLLSRLRVASKTLEKKGGGTVKGLISHPYKGRIYGAFCPSMAPPDPPLEAITTPRGPRAHTNETCVLIIRMRERGCVALTLSSVDFARMFGGEQGAANNVDRVLTLLGCVSESFLRWEFMLCVTRDSNLRLQTNGGQ